MYISFEVMKFFMYLLGGFALIAGIVLIVVAIMTVIKISKLITRVDKLVEINDDNINKTAKIIPEVVNNVNAITIGVRQGIDTANNTIESIGESISETVTTVSESTEGFFDVVSIAGEVIKAILNLLPAWKKK